MKPINILIISMHQISSRSQWNIANLAGNLPNSDKKDVYKFQTEKKGRTPWIYTVSEKW